MLNVHRILVATGFLAACLTGCRSYQLGTQSLHRPDVRTVHVPVFESDSFRRHLGERLTEAVVKQIELKTPYKVSDAASDSILSGRLISERKRIVADNGLDEPRALEVDTQVEIRWTDRRGVSLINGRLLPVPSAALSIGNTTAFVPETGDSLAVAQQRAIERLAEQIVSQMEMAW